MMKIAIFLLNLFDTINKKKIIKFFKEENIEINLFFDVGSHKGETVNLFNKNFNIGKIYCFEASKINYQFLINKTKNINNVITYNYGLGNENGSCNFNQLAESSSSSFVDINTNSDYYTKKSKYLNLFFRKQLKINTSSANIKKLKDFMENNLIKFIDILKIDTEGYEMKVIQGAGEQIKNIKYIYFEHHFDDMLNKGYNLSEIHEYLTKNGFEKKLKLKMFFRKSFEYIYKNRLIN